MVPGTILSPKYASADSLEEVKLAYDKTIGRPFPHCLLRDVFEERFLEGLKQEVMGLHYLQKANDLYDFLQSNDLKVWRSQLVSSHQRWAQSHTLQGCALPHVSKLKTLLYSSDFRNWLQGITGIEVFTPKPFSSKCLAQLNRMCA